MKTIAALTVATALLIGLAGAAQAWVVPHEYRAFAGLEPVAGVASVQAEWEGAPVCVGLLTGMAHPACDTTSDDRL